MRPVYWNPRFICAVACAKNDAFRKKHPEIDRYTELQTQRAEHLLKARNPNYGKVYSCYAKAAEACEKAGKWHKQKEYEPKAAVNLAKQISSYWKGEIVARDEVKKLIKLVRSLTLSRDDSIQILESLYPNFETIVIAFENSQTDSIPDFRNSMRKIIEGCYEVAKKLAECAPDRFEPRVMVLVLASKIVGKLIHDETTEVSRTMERTAHRLIAIYRDEVKTNIPAANEIAFALNRNRIPNDIINGRVTTIWNVSVPY